MSLKGKDIISPIRRVDIQVSIFTAVIVTISCFCVYAVHYAVTYNNMIQSLGERVIYISEYLKESLDSKAFQKLRTKDDMDTALYQEVSQIFNNVRRIADVRDLYTATRTDAGEFIYLIDDLPLDAKDFRFPGDLIEPEIIPDLLRAMNGEKIMPNTIKNTEWGKIFLAYLPVHSRNGEIAGVVGIEFEAGTQYHTYKFLTWITPVIILISCLVSVGFAVSFFRRISNPSYHDMSNTDQLTQLKSHNAFNTDFKNLAARNEYDGIGIMLLDLNNLKAVNDVMGHTQGNIYLQTVAEIMRQAVHKGETPYRIGGDEFAVLAIGADQFRMRELEQYIHTHFAEKRPDWPVDASLSVGWSIRLKGCRLQEAYEKADLRMYEQKREYHMQADHNRRNPR